MLQGNLNHHNFYCKPHELQLVTGTDGSLKPEKECNYCKDLGHLKYNCPKLKEKEARMAGHRDYNKSKKRKLGGAGSGDPQPGPSLHQK